MVISTPYFLTPAGKEEYLKQSLASLKIRETDLRGREQVLEKLQEAYNAKVDELKEREEKLAVGTVIYLHPALSASILPFKDRETRLVGEPAATRLRGATRERCVLQRQLR